MNIYDFADRYLRPYKTRNDEIIPQKCPFCGNTTEDQYTFALNTKDKVYNCLRGKCGATGTYNNLLESFGLRDYEKHDNKKTIKTNIATKETHKRIEYITPKTKMFDLTEQSKNYLRARKLSELSWTRYGLKDDNKGNILFPHYDETGKLCMLMFRPAKKVLDGEKKCWKESGGRHVFFGMHLVKNFNTLCITEGQWDSLSLCEAGIENAVSVPSGTNNLDCIDLCWSWLDRFEKIIIFGDNDKPGLQMVDNIVKKLGMHRCYVVNNTTSYKDANEILFSLGPDMLNELVNNAQAVSNVKLINLNDCKIFNYDSLLRIKTGFTQIDTILGGLTGGELTVITGNNASGKSTLVGQFCIEAIEQGYTVTVYSGELTPALYRYWIDLQTAGTNYITTKFDNIRQKDVATLSPEILKKIEQFRGNKWFMYESQLTVEEEELLDTFAYAAKRHNSKLLVIDNLMTMVLESENLNQAQSNFIKKLKSLAIHYDIHVILIAHPKKTDSEKITKSDIKGTGDISNLADNVMSINRLSDKQIADSMIDATTTLDLLKNRFGGLQDIVIPLKFDVLSKRFYYYKDTTMQQKDYLDKDKNWWMQEESW